MSCPSPRTVVYATGDHEVDSIQRSATCRNVWLSIWKQLLHRLSTLKESFRSPVLPSGSFAPFKTLVQASNRHCFSCHSRLSGELTGLSHYTLLPGNFKKQTNATPKSENRSLLPWCELLWNLEEQRDIPECLEYWALMWKTCGPSNRAFLMPLPFTAFEWPNLEVVVRLFPYQ